MKYRLVAMPRGASVTFDGAGGVVRQLRELFRQVGLVAPVRPARAAQVTLRTYLRCLPSDSSLLIYDNVADAAAKMGSKQIRRLVVLNEQGNLAGIISLGDIAVDYGAKKVGQTLEEISENSPAAH